MALRVTQNQLYGSFNANMNKKLSDLYETNNQGSSQLKINRPSDDPAGAGLVISAKANIQRYTLYSSNINQATGWLSMADSVLTSEGSVRNLLTSIQTLAQQAATGTYTKENREQISQEMRQLFSQLINLANSTYNGKHIFGGQKTESPAFVEGLGATSPSNNDLSVVSSNGSAQGYVTGEFSGDSQIIVDDMSNPSAIKFRFRDNNGNWISRTSSGNTFDTSLANDGSKTVTLTSLPANNGEIISITSPAATGSTSKSVIVQALGTGSADSVTYRYSSDGGETWSNATTSTNAKGNLVIAAGGAELEINPKAQMTAVDTTNESVTDNGSWMYIRPTALYKGDDNDTQVVLPNGSSVVATAEGSFARDVSVKVLDATSTPPKFAFSVDDGATWTETTGSQSRIAVPGGFLALSGTIQDGEQYTIHPHRASIDMVISESDSVTVNLVGKDVFGGYYTDPATGAQYAVNGGGADNVFEVVGRLIGYAETGSQEGVQKGLSELKTATEKIVTYSAIVGGRENRLSATLASIEARVYDETNNLSNLQDIDVTELMTKLSQQQLAYNSVLKSSSMIMQMSLVNFL